MGRSESGRPAQTTLGGILSHVDSPDRDLAGLESVERYCRAGSTSLLEQLLDFL